MLTQFYSDHVIYDHLYVVLYRTAPSTRAQLVPRCCDPGSPAPSPRLGEARHPIWQQRPACQPEDGSLPGAGSSSILALEHLVLDSFRARP